MNQVTTEENTVYQIDIHQQFDQSQEEVFKLLSDHERFGRLVGANVVRIVDSQTEFVNGVGSVRRISKFLVPAFEETITRFEPNKLIEYQVSKGSPIKQHLGRMEFSRDNDKTVLNYSIVFEPKLALPGMGSLLVKLIGDPIRQGLKRFADSANG
jgi:uncharacterized protein YndB with AHSA1/START domain